MMNILTKIFWPILRFFETDQVPENYKASHRVSLNVLGVLFIIVTLGTLIGLIPAQKAVSIKPIEALREE